MEEKEGEFREVKIHSLDNKLEMEGFEGILMDNHKRKVCSSRGRKTQYCWFCNLTNFIPYKLHKSSILTF